MSSVNLTAEMTLQASDDRGYLDETFDIMFFKGLSGHLTVEGTRQLFFTPEAIRAEMFYAAESQSLVFSRTSDHSSATLVQCYYENRVFHTMVLTATATGFNRTVVSSLVFTSCTIDRIIANKPIPMGFYRANVDLVSLITDRATVYPTAPHNTALLLARRDRLLAARASLDEEP
jgi:hypothetical protein